MIRRLLTTFAARKHDVPQPRGNYKDVQSFLQSIGRKVEEHAAKFDSWESLMTADSAKLRELGITDAKQRKYILRWVDNYKHGVDPFIIPITPKPPRGPKWRY